MCDLAQECSGDLTCMPCLTASSYQLRIASGMTTCSDAAMMAPSDSETCDCISITALKNHGAHHLRAGQKADTQRCPYIMCHCPCLRPRPNHLALMRLLRWTESMPLSPKLNDQGQYMLCNFCASHVCQIRASALAICADCCNHMHPRISPDLHTTAALLFRDDIMGVCSCSSQKPTSRGHCCSCHAHDFCVTPSTLAFQDT